MSILLITLSSIYFNIVRADSTVPVNAFLTRYVVGQANVIALEWTGIGRELYVDFNGLETFYHNDTDTEYSIVRTTLANETDALINIDGFDVPILDQLRRTNCLVYNTSNSRYHILVWSGGADGIISYGNEVIHFSGNDTVHLVRNYSSILEVDVDGFTHDCFHLINPDIPELEIVQFVPIVQN